MPTTGTGLVYPSSTDNVDPPGDIQALAASADTLIAAIQARLADNAGIPYAQSAGSAIVTTVTGGTPASLTVTLPVGRFSQAPVVTATAAVNAPGVPSSGVYVSGVGITGSSTASFSLWMTRSGAGASTVYWQAIQMTSSAAAG